MVKLNFSNAFNSIHKEEMLLSVYNRVLELYAYRRSAYSQSSCLNFGPYIVLSEEGAQQGDPIGSLLFCNTIHLALSSLEASLKIDYLVMSTWAAQ